MRRFCFVCLVMVLVMLLSTDVCAQTTTEDDNMIEDELASSLELSQFYDSLPPEVKKALYDLGVKSIDAQSLAQISVSDVFTEITDSAAEEVTSVFASVTVIITVLLLYALSDSFFQSMTNDTMKEVLSVVCALCIACALVIPVTKVIDAAATAINTSCNFMLAFVPIMVAVLVSCGNTLSGSGYYSLMIFAAQGIAQLSAKFITPMLNVFLGVTICSTVIPQVKLDSVTDLFAKTIKWMLSFAFTIFSALLTFRTLITTAMDSVSTRAVRFTLSSFIPVVGAALSEAYKTVQGSINILKNGIGVFVIFAVAIVFLPIVLRLLVWSFSVSLCKTVSQMLSLNIPGRMLSGVSTVLSVLLATTLCVMALFIISTALIITAGGYNR